VSSWKEGYLCPSGEGFLPVSLWKKDFYMCSGGRRATCVPAEEGFLPVSRWKKGFTPVPGETISTCVMVEEVSS
jgi:hypothetical protein